MARQQRLAIPHRGKVRADQILHALSLRHREDYFITEVKSGATWFAHDLYRLDAVAIKRSWANPCITAYEVKVDRSDFTRDEKWPAYLAMCHRFYFACPSGLIQPEELPPEVGLVWYNPETGGLATRKAAVYRPIELPTELLYYVILSRLDRDRHPFFSSRREFLEAWVQDKEERRRLGEVVGSRLAQRLAEAEAELNRLKQQVLYLEQEEEEYRRLRQILSEYGIPPWTCNWEEPLRELLAGRVPVGAVERIERIRREAEALHKMLAPAGDGGQP